MLVGTIAFNTLRVIDPSLTSALAILVVGYIFQGLGMAVTFIVCFSLNMRFSKIINAVAQVVYNCTLLSRNPIWIQQVAFIMVAMSVNNMFPVRGAAANSTFIAAGPPGFTALTILELGSYGRKMCANTFSFLFYFIFLIRT